MIELGGRWKAIVADEALRRIYPDAGLTEDGWGDLDVPGHWRSSPDFATTDGPLLVRRPFDAVAPAAPGRRSWLTFDGIFYQSDVWLDGAYLGDTEGYFFPHTFEVTEALAARGEHLLAAEISCAPQRDPTAKRNFTGVFQQWDCFDPDWNPGGIWRPVRMHETGPVRIARLRVTCAEATSERAVLSLRAILDAAEATTVELRTAVVGLAESSEEHTLAAGENRVEWRLGIEDPPLWWPHALGDARLVEVSVEARLPAGDEREAETSDARNFHTGLRKISLSKWIASVNGERLFLKGSNQGPTRMALGEATPGELARDVALAKEAGLDLLRIHAHISRPELYAAADEAGLLIWQDLPLQGGYARGTRKQAARQAREAVDLLAHHPSIALWCAHNDPSASVVGSGGATERGTIGRQAAGAVVPGWNKTVLDNSLRRALEKADRSRPVLAHSGLPTGDSHLYFGWHQEGDLEGALAAWPRLGRFVSEFGAHAVPDTADFMEPERWPLLDWDGLARTHGLQRALFERHGLDPASFATFDAWRDATQAFQARLVRRHVETLRRLKYRPTGGFAQFCFADGHPAVTCSVLDHTRRPKAGLAALREACSPVIVVAEHPNDVYRPGEDIDLDVHVVSDRREPLEGLTVRATLGWSGDEHRQAWTGDVPADGCVLIGTLSFVVPDAPGPMSVDLSLEGGDAHATNRYVSEIRRGV